MSVSILPLYRNLLKRIYTAAQRHPHHLQDVRFILSYPPVPLTSAAPVRPDAHSIGRVCHFDLRAAVLSAALPITAAESFVRVRALSWLLERLDAILSPATDAVARETAVVSAALTEEDFLPDAALPDGPQSGQKVETVETAEARGLASAGEIGVRREMFTLRHVERLPLGVAFLRGFATEQRALKDAAESSRELLTFVQSHTPRRVKCRNEEVELSVDVRPFDTASSRWRGVEGSPFAIAHRYFMIEFHITPLRATERVEIVNSYFLRLDVAASELVEDVGYIHASHLWRLLQTPDENDTEAEDASASNFKLMFENTSDCPAVMKGQLYYRLRSPNSEANMPHGELPLRCISFGNLLLFNDE